MDVFLNTKLRRRGKRYNWHITMYLLAASQLLYDSESWIRKKKDLYRIQAAEIGFLKANWVRTKGNRFRNDYIRQKLSVSERLNDKMFRYNIKWYINIERMKTDRICYLPINYNPKEKRTLGRSLKLWSERVSSRLEQDIPLRMTTTNFLITSTDK